MTRFDDFLKTRGIQPAALARRCGLSRMTIYRVRKSGTCSERTKRKLVIVSRQLIGDKVTLRDLFD
jgi:hypothetical protein